MHTSVTAFAEWEDVVFPMIKDIFENSDIDVTIFKL
jgi:hypothetical protein